MVNWIQRFKHLAIDVFGEEFKYDFDEFSLILSSIEKTANGCLIYGKFHVYSLGRYRFILRFEGEKHTLAIKKMFLPDDKREHD